MMARESVARGWIAVGAGTLAASWLFGGLMGLLAAVCALLILTVAGSRWVAAAAVVLFLVAVVATVIVSPPRTPGATVDFAIDRPVAAAAALGAGIFSMVAVIGFAARERALPYVTSRRRVVPPESPSR
jgi:hypothetical protein